MHSFENSAASVPAFLIKLWKLVEDPTCSDLIAWSDSGTSFIIQDQTRFSKELLPQYFKHNNMASFIRQLNMYGFRKVMNYEKSGLRNENDEMEFQHPFFLRGQMELLELIKRKISNNKVTFTETAVKTNARDILTDLSSIREKQENMDNMLIKMKQENELLWRELTSMRQKHKAQEQIIQKVIQFLVSIVQQSNQNMGVGVQRKMARMLHDSNDNKGMSQVIDILRKNKSPSIITVPEDKIVSPLGPVIHEVTDLDHEDSASPMAATVKSPEEKSESEANSAKANSPEVECPLSSCLNSPIDTSANMEPLSILEPLQPTTPVLSVALSSPTEINLEESVLGLPLDYMVDSSDNATPPSKNGSNNIIILPPNASFPDDSSVIYTTNSADFDSMSESLQTPQIPTIHIEDIYPTPSPGESEPNEKKSSSSSDKKDLQNSNKPESITKEEHNYQIAVTEPASMVKSSTCNNDEHRCNNLYSNSDKRLHASVPNGERRNTLSNHLLNVEEELNWLQDQIASNTWNIDASKLLGLFSNDAAANNETLAGELAAETTIKQEPVDIIGNELVQFTPSMLDEDLGLGNTKLFESLAENDTEHSLKSAADPQKNFLLVDVLNSANQEAASEAAEYLLNNGSAPKLKSPRRPKTQKLQKAKRQKVK